MYIEMKSFLEWLIKANEKFEKTEIPLLISNQEDNINIIRRVYE